MCEAHRALYVRYIRTHHYYYYYRCPHRCHLWRSVCIEFVMYMLNYAFKLHKLHVPYQLINTYTELMFIVVDM